VGELDLATVTELRAALAQHVDGQRAIALDLRELTFLDSTGLRLMVELWKYRHDKPVAFVAPTGDVARAIDISGLRNFLKFVSDPCDAGHDF
jgi:anti-anti-sigma factor